jgi:hypothetical protein
VCTRFLLRIWQLMSRTYCIRISTLTKKKEERFQQRARASSAVALENANFVELVALMSDYIIYF